ncbi:hypothetical protein PSX44_23500, partial [Shigella flexneri]|nr:hypothetical protein [Shigella flexneri]
MSLEICPFPLGFQICWHIIVHNILLSFFCIYAISVEITPIFISYFVYLDSLLVSLARSLLV